jgi:hypothetical protein
MLQGKEYLTYNLIIFYLISDNPDSKKLTTEIIMPISSSPELVFMG